MFTAITADEEKRRIFQKKIRLSYRHEAGISYALLSIQKGTSLTPKRLRQLKKLLGNTGNRLLCASGLQLPEEMGFIKADTKRYSMILAQNGLEKILQNAPPYSSECALLIDLNCKYQAFADILLRHYKSLRILTKKENFYRGYADARFYDMGASVILHEAMPDSGDYSLAVTPDGLIFPQMNRVSLRVLSCEALLNHQEKKPPFYFFHSFRAKTPKAYSSLLPPGIEEHQFQAALLSFCGVSAFTSLIPESVTINGVKEPIENIKIHAL